MNEHFQRTVCFEFAIPQRLSVVHYKFFRAIPNTFMSKMLMRQELMCSLLVICKKEESYRSFGVIHEK
jgi:hypothetical protein